MSGLIRHPFIETTVWLWQERFRQHVSGVRVHKNDEGDYLLDITMDEHVIRARLTPQDVAELHRQATS